MPTETTTPTTNPPVTPKFTATRNNITVTLTREETKKGKDGKEPKSYWMISHDSFLIPPMKAQVAADGKTPMKDEAGNIIMIEDPEGKATLNGDLEEFYGAETVVDYVRSKVQGELQKVQIDETDSLSMDEKRAKLLAWIANDFGGTGERGGAAIKKKMNSVLEIGAELAEVCKLLATPGNTMEKTLELVAKQSELLTRMMSFKP